MTKTKDSLNALRTESQNLQSNIAGLFSDGKADAKAELEKFQTDAKQLGAKLKLRAATEQGAIQARMHEAAEKLEAQRTKLNDKAGASVDATTATLEQAKVKLLDAITAATRSISEAVADQRTNTTQTTAKTGKVKS